MSYGYGGSYHHRDENMGIAVAGWFVTLVLFFSLIGAYLLVRAVLLVIRTFVKYPRAFALWFMLGLLVLSLIVALVLGLAYPTTTDARTALSVSSAFFWMLVLTAWVVKTRQETLLRPQPTFDRLVTNVLHRPWWHTEERRVPDEAAS